MLVTVAGKPNDDYVPDLPGCAATGATEAEVARAIREAIEFHLDDLMSVVEALCPIWPQREPFVSTAEMLL